MDETRQIDKQLGLGDTFSFEENHGIVEIYRVLMNETVVSISMSLSTVIVVVLFVTMNAFVTLMVIFCVLLVNLYMLALSHVWGLTFNNFMAINMSFALGVALDYSTHIAHTYLTI